MPMPRCEFQLLLQLVEHEVYKHYIRDADLGLGEHDGVEPLAGAGDHLDDVVVAPLRFNVVDAYAHGARLPFQAVDCFDDHAPGARFGTGCHGILQVEEHMIKVEVCRLGHHLL